MIDPNSKEDPKFKELIKVGNKFLSFFKSLSSELE